MFVISLLLSPMLVRPVPALSASPGHMVYRVQHARYGNIGTYSLFLLAKFRCGSGYVARRNTQ